MQSKKLVCLLLILLFAASIVPFVKADSIVSNGNWTVTTASQIAAGNSGNLSSVEYTYDITTANTTLSSFLAFDKYTVQSGPILPNVQKESKYFYERIGIETNQGTLWLSAIEVQAWYDWWGAYAGRDVIEYMNDSGVGIHNQQSYNNQNFNLTLIAVANYTTDVVTVYSTVHGNGYASVGAVELPYSTDYAYIQNFSLPSGSTPQEFVVYYGHQGNGEFQAYINMNVPSTLPQGGGGITPPPGSYGILSDIYNFFLTIWGFIVSTVTFLIAMIQAFWPIFPMLAVVYLIDLFYTSYEKGGVVAIGDTAYKVYTMIVDAAEVVVRAIRAIGQYVSAGIGWLLALFGIAL